MHDYNSSAIKNEHCDLNIHSFIFFPGIFLGNKIRVFCTREILSFILAHVLFSTLLLVILGCIWCGFLWRHEWKGLYLAHANCLRFIQEFLSFLFPPFFSPSVGNEPKSRQALYRRTNLSLPPPSFPSLPPFPFFLSVCLSGLELTMDTWLAPNCSNTPASASWALAPQCTTLASQMCRLSFSLSRIPSLAKKLSLKVTWMSRKLSYLTVNKSHFSST